MRYGQMQAANVAVMKHRAPAKVTKLNSESPLHVGGGSL